MKRRHLLLAFGIFALSACSDPTAPRLPQPEEEEEPDPDSPGIGGVAVVDHTGPRGPLTS
jgi:hypothetical protein